MSLGTRPREADGAFPGYAEPGERPPFASYAAFAAIFNAGMAGALARRDAPGGSCPSASAPATCS